MEINQVRYFLAVYECGSISQAAVQLNIAQPALSQSIARLEKALGVLLFVRSRRGAAATDAARLIYDDLNKGRFYFDQVYDKVRIAKSGFGGTLNVGIVSSALFNILPTALRKLKSIAPELHISLLELSNEEQVRLIHEGRIDIALVHSPVNLEGRVHQLTVCREKLIAAIPEGTPTFEKDIITLQEIARQGLVLYPSAQLPVLHTDILNAFAALDLQVRVNQYANRTLTVLACVAAGLGVGLLPNWIRSIGFEGVRFCDVADGTLPDLDLVALFTSKHQHIVNAMFGDDGSIAKRITEPESL